MKDELLSVPGIGPSICADLHRIGVNRVSDLRLSDPEDLYDRLCAARGTQVDRCELYVFRCAVYYAKNEKHDPELLKWWNWKT